MELHSFCRQVLNRTLVTVVYVRHLSATDADRYKRFRFRELDISTSWCKDAWHEDETFNHRCIKLEECIELLDTGSIEVKQLPYVFQQGYRKKFKLAYQRGKNFLERNGFIFSLRPITLVDSANVEQLISDHFVDLVTLGKAVGSTAEDYHLLVKTLLPDTERFLSLVGVISFRKQELLTSIFLGERTNDGNGGLYCCITCRNPKRILGRFPATDLTGFTALPQLAYAKVFGEMLRRGWKNVDLGGSETKHLDRFKMQMGALESPSTWLVLK